MSYDFSTAGSVISGSFTSTYTVPLTLAVWVKYTDHPADTDYILSLHKDTNLDEFCAITSGAVNDQFLSKQANSTGNDTAAYAATLGEYDGVWVPIVATFENTTTWNIFVEVIGNSGTKTASRDPGPLGEVGIGHAPNGAAHWINNIAEVAIWDGELSDANITEYMNGLAASQIDASNLIGYWPLDTNNATQSNEGTDATGDLTVTNATYDADHPSISTGDSKGRYYYAQQ
jgi:hypothetical protein